MVVDHNRKINIGILWANPFNKNLGVGALAYSILIMLKDIEVENQLSLDLVVFGSSIDKPYSIVIGDRSISFNNIRRFDLNSWKTNLKLAFFPSRLPNAHLMKHFDIVLDIGEGDSFTDIYGKKRYLRLLNSKIFFNKKRIPQVLLPQTIGPFKEEHHEKEAFEVMKNKNIKQIICRDKASYDYCLKHLPADKVEESIDVAFYLPFVRAKFDDGKFHVGINVSGLLWNGGYTRDNQFAMKTDYKKLMRSVLDFFSAQPSVQIHLIPHVVPTDFPVEDDYAVSVELGKVYKDVIIAPKFNDPIEAKGYISGLDFFTGARMHACIAAFSSGVPVVPMAYSRKFNGLFVDTLKYEWLADCVNESNSVVLDKIKTGFGRRHELVNIIKKGTVEIIDPGLKKTKEILYQNLLQY